jgi:hypothetical protein
MLDALRWCLSIILMLDALESLNRARKVKSQNSTRAIKLLAYYLLLPGLIANQLLFQENKKRLD